LQQKVQKHAKTQELMRDFPYFIASEVHGLSIAICANGGNVFVQWQKQSISKLAQH
jgi:hypothetical protein